MSKLIESFSGFAMIALYIGFTVCYFRGLFIAFEEGPFLWFLLNMIMPLGIITGFLDFVS